MPKVMQIFSMLSSRIFIVLHFTLRSVIYFELFFVTGVRSMSGSFFLGMWMSVVPAPFERFAENLCPVVLPLILVNGQLTVSYVGLFLGSLFH